MSPRDRPKLYTMADAHLFPALPYDPRHVPCSCTEPNDNTCPKHNLTARALDRADAAREREHTQNPDPTDQEKP